MSAFGTGSNSYGQFWFGGNAFPGFLYKKNVGVAGRRSTKFNPGGNITCNSPTYLYNIAIIRTIPMGLYLVLHLLVTTTLIKYVGYKVTDFKQIVY